MGRVICATSKLDPQSQHWAENINILQHDYDDDDGDNDDNDVDDDDGDDDDDDDQPEVSTGDIKGSNDQGNC